MIQSPLPVSLVGRTDEAEARTAPRRRRWARRLVLRSRLALSDLGPLARRGLDILVAGTAFVLVTPLLLLASIVIRLNSRGSWLLRQERIGQHGRPFQMFKLRTMVSNAEAQKAALAATVPGAMNGVRFKIARDPRITKVGRLLRKYSLDELPQLWNVVRGDMTLVGPRPPLRSEVRQYDARALRRLELRPGLTCLWQVGGRSDLSFEEQVRLDLEYIDRTRARDEVKILLQTIPAVLTGRGAY